MYLYVCPFLKRKARMRRKEKKEIRIEERRKNLKKKEKIDLKNGRKKGRQEEKTRAYKNVLKIYSPV